LLIFLSITVKVFVLLFVQILFCCAACMCEYAQMRAQFRTLPSHIYRRWHTRITLLLVHLNKYLISPFYLILILTNTPVNTYALVYIFYRIRQLGAIVYLVFLLPQICIPFIMAFYMAYLNKQIYSCTPLLFKRMLTQTRVRESWKCANYYEMLHRRKKRPLILTAGMMSVFSAKSLVEVSVY